MPTKMKNTYGHCSGVLKAGEFTFEWKDGNPVAITFSNPDCKMAHGRCSVHIKRGEPDYPFFGWDGNFEKPTLTPSVGCDHICGWHGHITAGVILP